MEFKDKVIGTSAKDSLTKRKVSKNSFFNQSTLVVRQPAPTCGFKEVNIKLFENGGVQMTGIMSEEFARTTLNYIIQKISNLPEPVFKDIVPTIQKFQIQLVNSDYKINGIIHRDNLHSIITKVYRLFSTYETTIYQGVNTKYYFNKEFRNSGRERGWCHCDAPCPGSGDGSEKGKCKKITISAFQTGRIIITGARNKEQLDEAYIFFNEILEKHRDTVILKSASAAEK
jgi:TATA-box binding protein (TBP) (component of TFIID and TFIIIB)